MAVPEQTPYKEYTANGVTTSFPLEFDCENQDHLIVTVNDIEPENGQWSFINGAVVFLIAPANQAKIVIQRNTPLERNTNYQTTNNSFRPQPVNKDFDRIWWKLQELGVADWILSNRINDLRAYVDKQDNVLQDNIDSLKNYVDDKDDELRNYLLNAIQEQGVALDQLEEYYSYLMQQLAQVAIDRGWAASFIVSADGSTQQQVNDRIGNTWYAKPLGYELNARVMLTNGDIVRSTVANNTTDPNVDMTGWVLESSKSVSNPSDLATLQNPKNKQRAYVESLQKTFIYDANLATPENGVTVIGKWEMQLQDVYYASWFASSDVQIAQDENLQAALNYATSKNRPLIIDAKFWVNAHRVHSNNPLYGALIPKSNSKIIFTPGSSINVIHGSATNYNVIACARSVDNIYIINPKLIGDRIQHTYTAGSTHEWGYGLVIYESSNVYVANLDCSNTTGDGLYIGKEWDGGVLNQVPTNIVVSNVNIDRVRRNGISFTAGDNVKILNPTVNNIGNFDGIAGTAPESGIDIEPEESSVSWNAGARAYIRNSTIHNLVMNNCGGGLTMGLFKDGRECSLNFTGLTVANNSKPFVIYNAVGTPTATSSQSGTIFIEDYLVTGVMSESVCDIGMREYGINVIVNKLTYTKGISSVIHQLTPEGTILNEFTKQIGGMAFNEIVTENSDLIFKIGRYFLGTDAMRQQARPNLKYFWKTPPKIPIDYDYDFAKPYGDNYRNNAVTTGKTQDYFNLSLMGGDTVVVDASVSEPAVTNPQIGRKMRLVLGFGVANYAFITGLGADTVLVKQDGTVVRTANLKLTGGGSWVELLKISDTQTQILGSYGSIQTY
ncbi:right-handed parallel beta-helix repeat-containing protein [Acinetobacter ursingii]|uniref:right-handed parallel beta-helix repeat-containing protein n=1 Tax=Acinetobacter ursingii TaxID=108980 RepID=UPI00300891E7